MREYQESVHKPTKRSTQRIMRNRGAYMLHQDFHHAHNEQVLENQGADQKMFPHFQF